MEAKAGDSDFLANGGENRRIDLANLGDSTSVARIPVATANRLTLRIQSVDMAWIN